MSAVRLFILVIAAIAAIALAFVVRGAFAPKKPAAVATGTAAGPAAPVATPVVKVLVAQHDLPVGTRLTAADMTWQEWPAANLNAAFITDGSAPHVAPGGAAGAAKKAADAAGALFGGAAMQSMVGAVVREPLLQGEPLIARKIVRAGEGNYMSVVLMPGMRAMAIPVSVDSAAGGFIMPGDRVDVLLSRDAGGKGLSTQTVLRKRNHRPVGLFANAASQNADHALMPAGLEQRQRIAIWDVERIESGECAFFHIGFDDATGAVKVV